MEQKPQQPTPMPAQAKPVKPRRPTLNKIANRLMFNIIKSK